jgi:hypothetical protein
MMTKEEFAREMRDRIQDEMGDGYEVKIQHVTKNNGVELTGLMVNDPTQNVAPTIYLDSMYEDVVRGDRSIADCAEIATGSIRNGMPSQKIDMGFFTDWEQVKDKVCFRLVNAEANREMLSVVPHEDFKDLAVTFFYPFEHDEIGKGSILIRNEHLQKWGVTEKELMEAARVNTPKLFPPRCVPMEDVLLQLMSHAPEGGAELPERPFREEALPMHVLTNGDRTYGAGVMMYDDYLAKVAEAAGCDLYVIPSSLHELIVLPRDGEMKGEMLRNLVREVNETQVDPQERLSYNVYEYDRQTQVLSTYEGREQNASLGHAVHEPNETQAETYDGPTLSM